MRQYFLLIPDLPRNFRGLKMLFEILEEYGSIERLKSKWTPREVELERYLVSRSEEASILDSSVFGEPLLLIRNQVATQHNKRADILALDRGGNGVIIELKRDKGMLGVETQALQYLSDFSKFKGEAFLGRFGGDKPLLAEQVRGFLGDGVRIEDLNQRSRVILMAQSFDPALFSMGEWLSDHGVAFRCVTYTPIELASRRFLSFSVAFDRTPDPLFPVVFGSAPAREPGCFWHNIARPYQDWWELLVEKGQIPACFDDEPGDEGERLLRSYISGDAVFAYAKGFGAVGWGVVTSPPDYQLIQEGCQADGLKGACLHRLKVEWKAVAPRLQDGVPPDVLRKTYGLYHPLRTSVSIDKEKAERLRARLTELFGPH